MHNNTDILISIKPKHAGHIFCGQKTVELRRRKPNISPGAKIWIYTTAPTAAIGGFACLDRVVTGNPPAIWREFGSKTGITKAEFETYFAECGAAHALVLSNIRVLARPLSLEEMRRLVRGFHPPQFFCRLNGAVNELGLNSRKSRTLRT